jgi:formate dehydrogenase iron-sulfur subunit
MSPRLCVDFSRCILCHACELACEREHSGAGGIHLSVVEQLAAVPVACRHCLSSPCAAVCPEQALVEEPAGRVVFLPERCTGCSLCVFACPFGALEIGSKTGSPIAKCDLCGGRTAQGSLPACVLTCPTEAIHFTEAGEWARSRRRREADRLFAARIEQP